MCNSGQNSIYVGLLAIIGRSSKSKEMKFLECQQNGAGTCIANAREDQVLSGEVVVGDPMFWKAPISGSVKRLGDSILLLSLFNLKHHLNLLVGQIGQKI